MLHRWALIAALIVGLGAVTPSAVAQNLAQSFVTPPADARPLVRWWWFGPAVEEEQLAREIGEMRAGGFGGFEIQPVYPLALDDAANGLRNGVYLSDEFLQRVRFAADTARAQGLRVDMTLGSGWPFGGPHISAADAAAQIRKMDLALPAGAISVVLPALGAGESYVAAFVVDGAANAASAANARAVTLPRDGARLTLPAARSDRTVLIFLQGRTGQQVKRAAIGAEGYVLDHMSTAAVRNHLTTVGEPLVRAFGEHPPYAIFSDSLEAYGSDWTDDFLAEFRRRRGYDLAPHLPALFFDTPAAGDIRYDWGLTLTELVEQRYLTPLNAWAEARRTRFRSQTYGVPPVTLSSNRLATLAEGEGSHWRRFTSMRWVTSANHLYGRAVTSAESWTWLHSPAFRATPLDIKAETDTLLLQGVNEFIAHGWPYSPPSAGEPGWAFYAAAVFNTHNPWWPVMGDVNLYIQRMSFLLRQGDPVADIAILLPIDDALAGITPGQATLNQQMGAYVTEALTQQILDAGYAFDYVDGPALLAAGFKHKVLILPRMTRIDPEVYRRVVSFAARGGIVLAIDRLPERGGGFVRADAQEREVRAISRTLFSRPSARMIAERDVGATLRTLTPPDLANAPPLVGFVHRQLANGELYFVANTTNRPVQAPLAFRANRPQGQWWDPRTGEAHAYAAGETVSLAPYESRVFVFGAAASAPISPRAAAAAEPAIDLSRNWRLSFEGQSRTRTVSTPSSWADDPATRFYSGGAIYSRAVTLTAAQIAAGQTLLHFGEGAPIEAPPNQRGSMALLDSPVREAALVFVNGQRAGAVWSAPFSLDLRAFLRPGANQLEVRVYNTAINAMAGRAPPDYRLLNLRYGERFQAQDMAGLTPLPSGLLQAITLRTVQ